MPKIPGIGQRDAVRVFLKAGFTLERQGRHIIMRRGGTVIQIPRHASINAYTMGGIAKQADLTPEQFSALL